MARKTNCVKNGIPYYRIHRKINGKYEDFYGKTKSEAENQYYERKKEAQIGIIQSKSVTINSLFPKWLFSVKIHEIKENTLESYESNYRVHIKTHSISEVPIKNISSIIVQDFYNTLFQEGKTTTKITHIHKTLSSFFKYVEKEGYISKNPCSNTSIPKDKNINPEIIINKQKLPFNYFTEEEIKIVRKAFKNNKYKDVINFALGTGMRQGEIIGLKKSHLDFEKKEIYVQNNLTRSAIFTDDGEKIGYKTKDSTPKTNSSIGIIPMSNYIYDLLKHLDYNPESEYVFTVNNHSIDKKDLEKNWRKVLLKLTSENEDFPYRRFHDLRHTFAVLLLQNGVDLYTIMKLLRHKKLSSTEIYLAVLPEAKSTSVNKINYIFKN